MAKIISGNEGDLNTPREYAPECEQEFINEVGSEITGACMVPLNLPEAEVRNIIKRAIKWFRKNYEYSLTENYYHIPKTVFSTQQFKETRTLNFPKEVADGSGEVFSIYGVYDLSSGWGGTGSGLDLRFTAGNDFAIEKMFFANAYMGTGASESAEELQYYYHGEKIDSFLNDEDNSDDFLALEDYEHTSWYDLAPEGLGFNEYGESEIDWDEY